MNYQTIYKLFLIIFAVLLFSDIYFNFIESEYKRLPFYVILVINIVYLVNVYKEKNTKLIK
jgi:hypothetical protein